VFKIIEDALKRKAQDEVPPPEVVDPTLKKISTVNQQAMERYIKEIEELRRIRQKEKETFYKKIENEIQKNKLQTDRMKVNHLLN
jgi:DNA repair ATPase RecN